MFIFCGVRVLGQRLALLLLMGSCVFNSQSDAMPCHTCHAIHAMPCHAVSCCANFYFILFYFTVSIKFLPPLGLTLHFDNVNVDRYVYQFQINEAGPDPTPTGQRATTSITSTATGKASAAGGKGTGAAATG